MVSFALAINIWCTFFVAMLTGSIVGVHSIDVMYASEARGNSRIKTTLLMTGFTGLVSAIVSILFALLVFFIKNHVH